MLLILLLGGSFLSRCRCAGKY